MSAINQQINLVGVPQVTGGLNQIVAATKQATAAVNAVGATAGGGAAGAASPFQVLNTSLSSTQAGLHATTEASHGLAEALHILHPALGELGGSMGELGSFARLAGAGLGAVAAAAGGAFLVAIQKAADEVGNLQRILNLQLGGAGKQAFDALTKSAEELHTSATDLLPAFQAIENALQRVSSFRTISGTGSNISVFRGLPGDPQKIVDVINSLNRAMQAITGDAGEATKAVNSFFQAITKFDPKTGNAIGLTQQAFIDLQSTALPIAKALEQAFGPGLFDRLKAGPISLAEVLTKLAAIKVNFDALKPPDTLAAALGEVKTAWEGLLKSLAEEGAFGVVTGLLHDFAEAIKTTKHEIELIAEAWNAFKKASEALPTPTAEETAQQITGTESSFKLPGPQVTSQQLTDLRLSIDRVKNDFDDLHTSSGQLKAAYDDQGTSLILAGVGMTNLAASVQKAADASATFAQRFNAVNDSLKKGGAFVSAPGAGQFGVPPGSKTVGGGGLGGTFTSAPGGAGTLTPEALLRSVGGFHTLPDEAGTLMPHVHLFDPAAVLEQVKQMGSDIDEAFAKFTFDGLTEAISKAIEKGGTVAEQQLEFFDPSKVQDQLNAIQEEINKAAEEFKKQTFDPSVVLDQVKSLGETIDQAAGEFTLNQLTESIDKAISDGGTAAEEQINASMSAIDFSGVTSAWGTATNTLVSSAQAAWSNIQSIFSQPLPAPSFGSSTFPGGFPLASGGLVRGPGTGTSDSIPAWLSNQEFVLTAASTKFWGAGLLNWMNRAPRFAGGGAVTSQSAVVHLHLGNESFAMNASENVATALRQHAVKSRLVSTGRKPSWY